MKHLALLLLLLLLVYFGWHYAPKSVRRDVSVFLGRHVLPVLTIIAVVVSLLFVFFYSGSVNFL